MEGNSSKYYIRKSLMNFHEEPFRNEGEMGLELEKCSLELDMKIEVNGPKGL